MVADFLKFFDESLLSGIAYIALYIPVFLFAKLVKRVLLPYDLDHQLTTEDNSAIALMTSGYYLAVSIIFAACVFGPSKGLLQDIQSITFYSVLGIIFLNLCRFFNDKLILNRFCNTEKLLENRNIAVGAVQFGMYVATGIIAAGSVGGQGGGLLSALVFFLLGQITLLLFSLIYQATVSYDLQDEVGKNNLAAGIAFGGVLIAVSIIVFNGVAGEFKHWQKDIIEFIILSIVSFVFLPLARLGIDRFIVPKANLCKEICEDKNIGAGLLEATGLIGVALIIATAF